MMDECLNSDIAQLIARIQALFRSRRYEEIVEFVGRLGAAVRSLPHIQYYTGLSLSELGRHLEAFQAFQSVMDCLDRSATEESFRHLTLFHAGRSLRYLGEIREGERWFDRIVPVGQFVIHETFEIYHGKLDTVMVGPGPIRLQVEPTNHCNLDCIMCSRRLMTRPLGMMDLELFERLVQEAAMLGTQFIRLFYLGEPFIHKGIGEMVRIAKQARIEPLIATNGLVLNERLFREVLSHQPQGIVISIDGDSPEAFERIRLKGNYQELVRNVRRMAEIRDELNVPTRLEIHTIHDPASDAERRKQFEMFWLTIVDRFVWMLPTDFGEGTEFVDAAGNVVSIDRIEHDGRVDVCPYPIQEMVIDWRGLTVPCCYDHDFVQKVGRFGEQTLSEMWRSPTMRELRQAAVNGAYGAFPICSICNFVNHHSDDA